MTTPDQNEARREAIQSLGDVISELPGILHPYNTATAVYAAGWRPPLSTPEASDDERYEDSADYAGSVEWLRELGVVPVAAKMFLDDVIKSARRSPVPADTPSDEAMGRAIAEAEDRRSLAEAEANGWPITPVRAAMTLDETADFIAARLARPTPPEDEVAVVVARILEQRARLDGAHEWPDREVMARFGNAVETILDQHAAALAAVPADRETEWEYGVFDAEGDWWASADTLADAAHYLAQEPDGKIMRRGPWLPIPESEEQR